MNPLSQDDLRVLDVFNTTYNARYLLDLEGDQDMKIQYIYDHSNPIQKQLIFNLKKSKTIEDSFETVDYIEGPHMLTKLKLTTEDQKRPEKSAYIFGESHFDKEYIDMSCYPNRSIQFQDYLLRLARDSPSFIDVYLELPLVKSTIVQSNSIFILEETIGQMYVFQDSLFLPTLRAKEMGNYTGASYIFDEISKQFSDCIQPGLRRTNNICNIMRFHNIDIRSSYTLFEPSLINAMMIIYTVFKIGLEHNIPSLDIFSVLNRIRDEYTIGSIYIIDDLLKLMKTGSVDSLIFDNIQVKKELDQSYKKEDIKNFIRSKVNDMEEKEGGIGMIREVGSYIEKALIEYRSKIQPFPVKKQSNINRCHRIIREIGVFSLDTYCLSRIFKEYIPKPKLKPTDPEPQDHPRESRNIIIYAGAFHSRTYIEFFKTIGFRPVFEFKNPRYGTKGKDMNTKAYCVATNNQASRSMVIDEIPQAPQPRTMDPREMRALKVKLDLPFVVLVQMAKNAGYNTARLTKLELIKLLTEHYITTGTIPSKAKKKTITEERYGKK